MAFAFNVIKLLSGLALTYFLFRKSERDKNLERALAFFGSMLAAALIVLVSFEIIGGFVLE